MPSLRKRVSSYFRQLSFHNEPREKRNNFIENTFINKYLQGEIKLKEGPPIIYGKNPTDLPNYDLGAYGTGSNTIVGCYTGPCGGLTTVKRSEKHLSVLDQDIDFIDTAEEIAVERKNSKVFLKPKNRKSDIPLDNTTMVIKVAGQEYLVTNSKKRHNKSHSLGSLSDFKIEVERTKKILNNNNVTENNNGISTVDKCDKICDNDDSLSVSKRHVQLSDASEKTGTENSSNYSLGKSKSEGNPFGHIQGRTGKITRLTHRPTVCDSSNSNGTSKDETDNLDLPPEWRKCSEFVYGMSDSLYDKNLITKRKNGDPIADCFGIIARGDSAILAVADGVNWGEKACIAAKSAIHGCLHYLNKTLFLDTKPFDNLIKTEEGGLKAETPIHEARINNTREVFICLLRAFNCAHDLILENNGMLTTLTVAVILPLKQSNVKSPKPQNVRTNAQPSRTNLGHRRTNSSPDEVPPVPSYICCVCNVGDTLAYVYSQKYGVRELTKGSHDINCNRDMRDALGALGPVDGINPELSNLTLAITTIQKGDIVMIASDGLTDNFDPNVCKFTINSDASKARKVSVQQNTNTNKENQAIPVKTTASESTKAPVKPPRKHHPNRSSVESNKSVTIKTTPLPKTHPSQSKPSSSKDDNTQTNPLVAQFLKENSLDPSPKTTSITSSHTSITAKSQTSITSTKKHHSLQKSSTSTKVPITKPQSQGFLRSKTSVDLRGKTILRNPDGIPFVTPLQRYELTLLLMEDILKRGISGKENQCVTAKKLCENLISFTISITNAKRRTLEDTDLYFNDQNGVLIELSQQEKKLRRRKGLEKVQNLPGKLDHVTVLAYNVGNSVLMS